MPKHENEHEPAGAPEATVVLVAPFAMYLAPTGGVYAEGEAVDVPADLAPVLVRQGWTAPA